MLPSTAAPRKASRPRASRWSALILLMGAVPRAWAALLENGIFWPDETVLTTEPAHYLAFGWGMLSREFREGARSWLFPGFLGGVWKLAALAGVSSSAGLMGLARSLMAIGSIVTIWLAMSLARRLSGERAAIVAGLLLAGCPPLVAFGSRCIPENVAAPLVLGAILLLEARSRRAAAIAGALAAIATLLQYVDAFAAVGLLATLVGARRRADARAYAIGAAATGLLGGLLDWPTWGWPFKAVVGFVKLTFSDDHPPFPPPSYYGHYLSPSLGLSFGLILLGLALAWRSSHGLAGWVAFVILSLSFVAPKELRFVLPVLPVALAVAAVGLVRLMRSVPGRGWPTYALGLACAAQMVTIAWTPTRGELGFGTSDWVIWHSGEDYFRTVQEAAKAPDLCGIILVGNEPRWTGGYSYLHRAVPLFFDLRADHLAGANYLVGAKPEKLPAPWASTYSNGKYALYRREGGCDAPPRDWTMNLP